jgi:hypothetical protein
MIGVGEFGFGRLSRDASRKYERRDNRYNQRFYVVKPEACGAHIDKPSFSNE